MFMPIPDEEAKAFLTENCQVFNSKTKKAKWMKRSTLKKQVIAGKAEHFWVQSIDFETGEMSLICPYCATGVEHRGSFH